MFLFLRILFPAGFIYCLFQGSKVANTVGGVTGAINELAYIVPCLVFALLSGFVWAPWVGEKVAQPLTDAITGGTYLEYESPLLKLARWASARKRLRLAVFFCYLEALNHPAWPGAFVLGMNCARPGSWSELYFAWRVYDFENAHNCVRAYEILKQHGRTPRPHPHPEVHILIAAWESQPGPDRPALPIPPAPAPQPLQRDARIKLFEDVPAQPVVPPPSGMPPKPVSK